MTPAAGRAIATPHALATEAGLGALRRGGSAADAAIAANAVLCVAYPHMAGLGGDGFWLVWDPDDRRAHGINASGPAARLATPDLYLERGLQGVPERGGPAALTVPGAVDGWRLAHERWGRLPWAELFADAIRLAAEGVPVAPSLARYHRREAGVLRDHAGARELFAAVSDGAAGGPLVQPRLAATLRALAGGGARAGFYEGAIARELGRALEGADSPLRAADLGEYRAEWVEPLRGAYRGVEVLELPPNTQGIAAIQILRLLEGYDVAAWGDGSADYIHALVEATKLAFADRDAWVADPRYVTAPLERLASPEYADARRALIEPQRALPPVSVEPGIPRDRDAGDRAHAPSRDGDTCYFCVVDGSGLAVSCIQSIYFAFGSMVVAGDTGILLQNRGTAFSLDANSANALEPGKRPLHTLIPGMLLKEGAPLAILGTMGGEGQPQTQGALVTRLLDFGYDAGRAVEAPRWLFGRTWGDASQALSLESRFDPEVVRALRERGHDVRVLGPLDETMGHAQMIVRRPDGTLDAAADPRGDGSSRGE